MVIPTEPIGSVPRPAKLIQAVAAQAEGAALEFQCEEAIRDTVAGFEGIGSPVMTDWGQRKYEDCWTYCPALANEQLGA